MCLDLYFAEQMEYSTTPLLRFYGWNPFCLSLGHHQKSDLINIEKLQANGYDIVRRPTGGSAILHSDELTYSFILPRNKVNHHAVYAYFHSNLAKALNSIGYNVELAGTEKKGIYLNQAADTFACFNRSALSEIQYDGKKVVGSAQKLLKYAILQHGSIMIKPTHEEIIDYLLLNPDEQQQQKNLLKEKSMSLEQVNSRRITVNEIADPLLDMFEKSGIQMYYRYPSNEEIKDALKYIDQVCL